MYTIIYILIVVIIIIILIYYAWYIRNNEDINRDFPFKILYRNHTIVDMFDDITRKYGNHTAMKKKHKNKWINISYSEYHTATMDFSQNLLYFIGPHPRVAILSSNRPEWFYAHMGSIIACGVSVGITPNASSETCAYIINNSCSDVIVIENYNQLAKFYNVKMPTVKFILLLEDQMNIVKQSDHLRNTFKKLKENILPFNSNNNNEDNSLEYETNFELIENIKLTNKQINMIMYDEFVNKSINNINTTTTIDLSKPCTDDIVSIIYSSESDHPNGVVITHKNIISSLRLIMNSIQCRSNITLYIQERMVSYLPLNQMMTHIMDMYIPLASVGIVHFITNIDHIDQIIKEIRPTLFVSTHQIWESIIDKIKMNQSDPNRLLNKLFVNKMIIKDMGLDKCKYCITTSQYPPDKKDFFKNLGLEMCEMYNMNESTGPISVSVPGSSKGMGIPIVNVKINRDNNEIMVKGDTIFKEYYKNIPATQSSFNKKGWFKTGDTGYVDRDGTLYVTGEITNTKN